MQAELELPANLGKAPAASRIFRWKMDSQCCKSTFDTTSLTRDLQ